ncbi:YceI family protein [Granulicella tundricola]|nr:YceI family protein [Granulicella tundricola]
MKLLNTATLLAAALTLSTAAHAQATAWTIDSAHSGVNFEIRHLGVSNVRGSFHKVTGTINLDEKNITHSSVEATIDTTTVNTDEPKRDDHLKSAEFFNVAQFPTMTFKSTSFTNVGGKLKMTGNLTLDGVTKPVTLDVDGPAAPQKGMGGKTVSGFSASGVIHRAEFNFGQKYTAPMLGDDVKFTIDIEMGK